MCLCEYRLIIRLLLTVHNMHRLVFFTSPCCKPPFGWYFEETKLAALSGSNMAVGQTRYQLGVGEFTTHFRTYFSGWIESDVHGQTGILTHGHMLRALLSVGCVAFEKTLVEPEAFGLRPELERRVLALAMQQAEAWPSKAPGEEGEEWGRVRAHPPNRMIKGLNMDVFFGDDPFCVVLKAKHAGN